MNNYNICDTCDGFYVPTIGSHPDHCDTCKSYYHDVYGDGGEMKIGDPEDGSSGPITMAFADDPESIPVWFEGWSNRVAEACSHIGIPLPSRDTLFEMFDKHFTAAHAVREAYELAISG